MDTKFTTRIIPVTVSFLVRVAVQSCICWRRRVNQMRINIIRCYRIMRVSELLCCAPALSGIVGGLRATGNPRKPYRAAGSGRARRSRVVSVRLRSLTVHSEGGVLCRAGRSVLWRGHLTTRLCRAESAHQLSAVIDCGVNRLYTVFNVRRHARLQTNGYRFTAPLPQPSTDEV